VQIQPIEAPADYWDISSSVTRLPTDAESEIPPTLAGFHFLVTRLDSNVGNWIVNEIRHGVAIFELLPSTPGLGHYPDLALA